MGLRNSRPPMAREIGERQPARAERAGEKQPPQQRERRIIGFEASEKAVLARERTRDSAEHAAAAPIGRSRTPQIGGAGRSVGNPGDRKGGKGEPAQPPAENSVA